MKKDVLFFASVALILGSCSPKYYSPNTHNVPLLSEQGEINLNVSGNGNQVEFQGAYAVTDGFAIQANGGLFIPSDLDNGDGGSAEFGEIGLGYFRPITENWIFETYALAGFGKLENHLPSTMENNPGTTGKISANLYRFGIQPSFGYKSEYFSAAVSSRFVNVSYNKVDGSLIFENMDQEDYLNANSSNFMIEPALTIRGGFERFKLQVQYGYSINVTQSSFRQDNSHLTIGLNFNFK
jgi:hypothetical protein